MNWDHRGGGHFSFTVHDASNPVVPGRWYHLAIIRDVEADDFQVFLDGNSFGRRKSSFALGRILDVLQIGSSSPGPGRDFSGKVDEFAVYDYARSPDQIALEARKAVVDENSLVLRGRLFHNGLPITTFTHNAASFWFRNESTGKEQKARVNFNAGAFEISGIPSGRYGVDVRIRTGAGGGHTGDFQAWKTFSLLDNPGNQELLIDLYRIMHMTSPQDNSAGLARWNAECEGKMSFASPVRFERAPLGATVTYSYRIEHYQCKPFKRIQTIREDSTYENQLSIDLPSSNPNELYVFSLSARNGNLLVGKLETYGINGGRGWDYRFRVE